MSGFVFQMKMVSLILPGANSASRLNGNIFSVCVLCIWSRADGGSSSPSRHKVHKDYGGLLAPVFVEPQNVRQLTGLPWERPSGWQKTRRREARALSLVPGCVVPVDVLSPDHPWSMQPATTALCRGDEPETDSRVSPGTRGPDGGGTVSRCLEPES